MLNQPISPKFDNTPETNIQADKSILRQKIRKQRRCLNPAEQRKASRNLTRQLYRSRLLLRHQFIALYLGSDGELNPEILIKQLWRQKKHVYLPVIHPFSSNRLFFCRIQANTQLIKNKFGILEPDLKCTPRLPKQCLSLVLMPLVAFDSKGNRMGMGGGFYDRSFAYKADKNKGIKPKLVGIAHAFQEQTYLPVEPWDIPLEGILTDKSYYQFK
tara:strand:+ start:4322 stop:4966 length:645 start_codon:yes stop_codon:yes gene_type:complete